jgi:hypothetical protein
MPAPTFEWSETNGSGATVTDNQTNGIVFASTDANSNTSNLASNYPLPTTGYSYEKWWRLKVTGAAPTSISSFGVYFSSTAPTDYASGATLTTKFGVNASYATPVDTASSVATTLCSSETSAPGTSFTAPGNVVNDYSGYITQQLATSSSSGGPTNWASPWMSVQYSWD